MTKRAGLKLSGKAPTLKSSQADHVSLLVSPKCRSLGGSLRLAFLRDAFFSEKCS
jgi:hypothetical protein